jgi:hypothetical protein
METSKGHPSLACLVVNLFFVNFNGQERLLVEHGVDSGPDSVLPLIVLLLELVVSVACVDHRAQEAFTPRQEALVLVLKQTDKVVDDDGLASLQNGLELLHTPFVESFDALHLIPDPWVTRRGRREAHNVCSATMCRMLG